MLSICIPTLNRPYYLFKALYSIYHQEESIIPFEICISNNFSDYDYTEVELYIQQLNEKHRNIKYVKQEERLSLDKHMHFVINMSEGDYVYLLGDDDYFKKNAFIILDKLIHDDIDLAVVNANWIDGKGKLISPVHSEPVNIEGLSKYEKYLHLYNKCTYGALLIRKSLFSDNNFKKLYNTSHAYGCFWIELLNNDTPRKITYQSGNVCVNLRAAEKSYNLVDVIFNDVNLFFVELINSINSEEGKDAVLEAYRQYKESNSSIRFLCGLQKRGVAISQMKYTNNNDNSLVFKVKKLLSYAIFKLLVLTRIVNL
ncbi:glycosyltransferase family 2 protein [Vibrio gazogenes]|uniref:Glycosyltransferase 2-like domain-containing protein n=1 Tax=Vibrio gazogenes TaxID=687 RepID=A0A1Z2SFP1_VIBGA|nr:glycosyltransferase [Vibrio gazogenes]ASA55968.1 hypothetical protein BSQ33_09860 [Vibrio gazogenes]